MLMKIIKTILGIIGILIIFFVLLIGYLTLAEYKPAATEPLEVQGDVTAAVPVNKALRVMSWNVGYGALGDNADFFMDGGSHVNTASKERLEENMGEMENVISEYDPDLLLLQEVDRNSYRSHHVNEMAEFQEILGAGGSMVSTFANNHKVAFVPYPMPPIGKVDAGVMTMSAYRISEASRVQLPIPFTWPLRIANLKRCLAVNRLPVEGSDKELVLIDLHLEAYDSGEGKVAQTKMLADLMKEELDKGNYVIAGGDFNQTFSNVDTSMYPELPDMWHCGRIETSELDSRLQFLMDNRVPTCRSLDKPYEGITGIDPESFQYYMIDGFIVSDNIKVENLTTHDQSFANSDHNPVTMEVTLQ